MPATTTATRLDFSSRVAKSAAAGFDFIRDAQAAGSDYADLFAAELSPADYAGTALDGFNPADVATYMNALTQINAVMDANGGAARIAAKRLAQFSR